MEVREVSRRRFIQGVATCVAGASTLGAVGSAWASETSSSQSASAQEGSTSAESEDATAQASEAASYEVYHTEVLIIGGGSAGIWAARDAMSHGKQVMIVEKGPFRHGGVSGMSWDVLFLWAPTLDLMDQIGMVGSQTNRKLFKKAYDYVGGDAYNPLVALINQGETIPYRAEDGSFPEYIIDGCANSVFYRREMDTTFTDCIPVMDQVMITGLFENNGRCLGAMGVHLPTGRIRVITADATIIASNAGMLFRGCHNIGYWGISSEDCTGDVDMAALRSGMAIGEAEYSQYDINAIEPADLAHTMGAAVMADGGELQAIYDVNHEPLFARGETENLGMIRGIAKAVYEDGLGTENNGIYIHFGEDAVRYNCTRNAVLASEFGLDPFNDYVEAAPEMFEHGGAPVIDENMMTEWQGLFDTRGAGACGAFGGTRTTHNRIYGPYASKCACDFIDTNGPISQDTIDWSQVDAEYARLHEIRTRKVDGGIRPFDIRHRIQLAGGHGFDVYRPTAWMEEAVTELERIRKEDMPLQMPADDSLTFNTEWKTAIENINLLDEAEVSIKASLLREESRGSYLRPEFPDIDDENWNCMLTCRLVDGEMTFEKKDITGYESWE